MAGAIEARLAALGIELPQAAAPAANYVPTTMFGGVLYVAGQIPMWNGERRFLGTLGDGVAIADGQAAARLCALNIIAQAKRALGDLDRITQILRLGGFVASTAAFGDQPQVVNGASDLMVEVFGDKGRHARAAVGVSALPFGVAVEVEATIAFA
jgi:enamine deaminase RidA (YjgF/YER057c/UK114 family)